MDNEPIIYGENDTKKRKKGHGCLLSVIFILLIAVAAAILYFRNYTPDPDKNSYETLPGIILPDYDENTSTSANGFFEGQKQAEGRYNFLIVGLDRISRSTDIMMIVSYDVKSGEISVVQIPRDTYMKTSFVKTVVRINSYYSIFYKGAKQNGSDDPDRDALINLAALIQHTFAVRLNYCALVDLDGFENIINAVGGVDIYIPEDMFYDDPYQDLYIDLKAGYQHLDGHGAMQYVRFRKGYAEQDIGRQNALKNFMSALMAQLKANLNIGTVANVAGEVIKNLNSNISAADFVYFAKSALSVDLSNVKMMTLPGKAMTVNGASVYVLYRDDTVAALNKYLNVFERELTAEYFDPDSVLYRPDDPEAVKIYESPLGSSESGEYNAEDLNREPIDIPRR